MGIKAPNLSHYFQFGCLVMTEAHVVISGLYDILCLFDEVCSIFEKHAADPKMTQASLLTFQVPFLPVL